MCQEGPDAPDVENPSARAKTVRNAHAPRHWCVRGVRFAAKRKERAFVALEYTAEQVWLLAENLARTGHYADWRAIERELPARNFSRAAVLLNSSKIRDRLDDICAQARSQ